MFQKTILTTLLATAGLSAFAANYYVVAPLPGKEKLLDSISVALGGASLPSGEVGQPYAGVDLNQVLQVRGDPGFNPAQVGWSIAAGSLPPGLTLNKGIISGTPTAAGERNVSVRAVYKTKSGERTYQILAFNVAVALTPGALPAGVQGAAYNHDLKTQLAVTGDPAYAGSGVSWAVASGALPAGLSLNAATGAITGVPTAEGTSNFTVRASYKTKAGEQVYQVVVGAITVNLASGALPAAALAQAYSADLKSKLTVAGDAAYAAGAGVAWSVASGVLPAGLSLNAATGEITGTPTAASTSTFTAKAVYKTKVGQQSYSIEVPKHNLVLQPGGYRTWSDGTVAASCKQYLAGAENYAYAGATGNGVYRIQPAGWVALNVYCDMDTDGGGWTLVAWNKGVAGLVNMPRDFFVKQVNVANIANRSLNNTSSSMNVEGASKALGTTDVMLVSAAYSAAPLIEKGQGVWSYDSPDCTGALAHTGRDAGCVNQVANDNQDSADKYNIAITPYSQAIVPGWLNDGYELCYPGKGWCNFEFYLR